MNNIEHQHNILFRWQRCNQKIPSTHIDPPGYSGFGYLGIEMRWRIDALGAPAFGGRP